jgi:hypothetical protein
MPTSSALRSGIKNYERYLNILAGTEPYVAPPMSEFDLLDEEILASTASSITFSSLSTYAADYQHLQMRAVLSDAVSFQNASSFRLRFNGDSGNNYSWHSLGGNGSTITSIRGGSQSGIFGENAGNGFYSGHVIDILDPYSTSRTTTARLINGYEASSAKSVSIHSGFWMNTAAVTSITIATEGFGFVSGSRLSLYGVKTGA